MDRYLFGEGTHYEIYKLMGAHPTTQRGKDGVYFAVWAPHAESVSVVGDFNKWDPDKNVMKCDNDMGIYQLFVPKVRKVICTNSASPHTRASCSSRQTPMQTTRSTARVQLPVYMTSPNSNGEIPSG